MTPAFATCGHPGSQQDLRAGAAEAFGELEADRRPRVVRLLWLRLPQRRFQLDRAAPAPCKHVLRRHCRCWTTARRNLPRRHTTTTTRKYRKPPRSASSRTSLDRTLSVNGALFHTDVEDMQFFNFFAGPFGLLRVVTNIDEVTIQGGEIDARWKANDMFTIFGGYGFTDGNIDKYAGRPYTKATKCRMRRNTRATSAPRRTFPMGAALQLLTRARRDVRRRDLVPSGAGGAAAEPVHGIRLRPGRVLEAEARSVRASSTCGSRCRVSAGA